MNKQEAIELIEQLDEPRKMRCIGFYNGRETDNEIN